MTDTKLDRVLSGEAVWPPPIWIMRQAGRYLPEYRKVRAEAGSFLDLCYNPRLATEVTLQPIRRFGFDAAILFSDILVIPHALGQHVWFAEGEGPRLEPITDAAGLDRLGHDPLPALRPVLEALALTRTKLPRETALLGFCGAPWTVACYMIAGRGTPDQAPGLDAARRDPGFVRALIDRLVMSSITYLLAKLEHGAGALQIFESHGGSLPPDLVGPLSLDPIARIVRGVREARPEARIILFPRGGGAWLEDAAAIGVDGIGIDQHQDLAAAVARLPGRVASQGNIDPEVLIRGGEELDAAVDAMLDACRGRPHIANLGHGITPQTPIDHVARMIARIRAA